MSGLEGSNANTCVVCYKNVQIYSIGMCDHPVCYECSTRMRVLCRQNECPICRQDLPEVVFTRDIKPFRNPKNEGLPVSFRYNIYFESPYIHRKFYELLAENCTLCCKKKTFESFEELKDHMRHNHQLYHCDLCVENLKIFSRERRWYTRSELSLHRRKGDADDKSHRGHPLCEFCNQRYMDNDELYRHLRRDHLYCHFCDEDGLHQYYNSYDYLRDHFRLEHFLCEEGSCADEKFTSVFRSNIDLKAHRSSAHSKQLSKAAAKQARTLELEFTLAPRTRTRRLPFQNRREREFSSADGSGQSQASSSQSGVQGVQAFSQLPAPSHHQQNQHHQPNHHHQPVGQAYQNFQTDDFPCYLEPTFMRPRVDVRSTEEFPTLGGVQAGSTVPQRPSGRSGNVTIRSTVRNHLPLAVTDENFPALGPDSVSKTVNVSLSGNPGGGSGNGASNVSIQVNHEANGTVMRVSGPNIRIRPTLKIDNDFPALGEASGSGSSAAGAPWKEVLQWTCSKGAAKMAAAGAGRKKGAQGHQQAAAGIHGEDFPSLSKSKKQATITVVPTWGPQAQTSGGQQQGATSGGQAAKGKTKKRKEKQKSGLGSSGLRKENERVDGLESATGSGREEHFQCATSVGNSKDEASRCSDVKMAENGARTRNADGFRCSAAKMPENVAKMRSSKADAENFQCSPKMAENVAKARNSKADAENFQCSPKMAENVAKVRNSKADAENFQCSSKMAENGNKVRNSKADAENFQCSPKMAEDGNKTRNSKADAENFQCSARKMAENASKTRNPKVDAEDFRFSDVKMADNASRIRNSRADAEHFQYSDAKMADSVSRIRNSRADKENCQFSDAKMADSASRIRSSKADAEHFQYSDAKMADNFSKMRNSRADKENCQFSDAKMADNFSKMRNSRADKENCQFSDAKMADNFSKIRNSRADKENCHFSDAKMADNASRTRNFQPSSAKMADNASKIRNSRADKENCQFSDAKMADNASRTRDSKADAENFEFSDAKMAVVPFDYFDGSGNAGSPRSDKDADDFDYFGETGNPRKSAKFGSAESFDYFENSASPRNAGKATGSKNGAEGAENFPYFGDSASSKNPAKFESAENLERYDSKAAGNSKNVKNGARSVAESAENDDYFDDVRSAGNSKNPAKSGAARSAEDAESFDRNGGGKTAGNSKGRFDYFENAESSRSGEGAENFDCFNGNSRGAGSGNPGAESSEGFDYFNYTGKPRNAVRTGSAWSNENDLEAGNPAKRRNPDTGNPSKSRNPVGAGNDGNYENSRNTGSAENSRNGAKFGNSSGAQSSQSPPNFRNARNSQNFPNFPSPESPENSHPSLKDAVRSSNCQQKDRRKQPRTMDRKDNDCYATLNFAKSVHNSSDSNDSSPEQSANSKSGGKAQRKRTELKIDGLNANSSSSNDSNSCEDCPASSVSSSSSAKPPGFTQPPPGFTNPPPGFGIKYALDNDLTFTNSSGETYSIVPERRRQRDLEKRPAYSPPADFQERNKRLVARLNDVLREQDDIDEFRRISGCFRQGSCTPNDYYEHCRRVIGQDTFREIFPELLLLLPDIAQQQELFRVFREGDNGGAGVWLEECPSCRQILRAGNEVKTHREGHEKEKDFPELGKVGGGRAGWVRK